MADIDNLAEINENFDTVKTLLNSIRAQGILNTSDVDKLLSGINNKLEKINTEEDIDLIKMFLSELKQTLDERHNVLVSKFGAIEALFSNLLKNSNELPKASELKELFDVVATNLSVFSREVVSQKETLTDITLRLDAIRSDDSQKKDIIKNITLLKPDLERLNNGFDTIVLSLNDNFKTIVKTISSIDNSQYLDRFAENLNNIETSNKALLSAIQILDKKSEVVDSNIDNLVTKEEFEKANKNLSELKLLNRDISEGVNDITSHYGKMDMLADKVDASVNIIASLKSVVEDSDNENTAKILESLDLLSSKVNQISSDTKFDEFKESLTSVLKDITENTVLLDKNIKASANDIETIIASLKTLEMDTGLKNVIDRFEKNESDIKTFIENTSAKTTAVNEANITKVLNEISANADSLSSRLQQAGSEITLMCESNFDTVFKNVSDLKATITQLDENNVSSNNAIFSNITDRLDLFESTLKNSLSAQEASVNKYSSGLGEQVDLIKNLSTVLDYKMDSSVVEIAEMKREFGTLKTSVDNVLALDFVETVKDLRADLYASKQDLSTALQDSGNSISEKFTNDLYGKYELIISKMDSIEEDFRKTQTAGLNAVKETFEKISASIVDIMSYVSEQKDFPSVDLDKKLDSLTESFKDANIDYVESVRDIVNVIRVQVEADIKALEESSQKHLSQIENTIAKSSEDIRSDIKASYDKVLEVQALYNEIKKLIESNDFTSNTRYEALLSKTNGLNGELDSKILSFKNDLLDKVSSIKQDITVSDSDKINEFRFTVENLYNKNSQEIFDNIDSIKELLNSFKEDNSLSRESALGAITENLGGIKEILASYIRENSVERTAGLSQISDDFSTLNKKLAAVQNGNKTERETALNKIFEKFTELKDGIVSGFETQTDIRANNYENLKSGIAGINSVLQDFESKNSDSRENTFNKISELIDGVKNQLNSLYEDNSKSRADVFEKINEKFSDLSEKFGNIEFNNNESREAALDKISGEFGYIKSQIAELADNASKLRSSALAKILENFVGIKEFANTLADNSSQLVKDSTDLIDKKIESVMDEIKTTDSNIDRDMTRQLSIIESNFESLISQINILAEKTNEDLADRIKTEFADISQKMDENVTAKLEEYKLKIEETFDTYNNKVKNDTDYIHKKVSEINDLMKETWKEQADSNYAQIETIASDLKSILENNIRINSDEYDLLKSKFNDFSERVSSDNEVLASGFKDRLDEITHYIQSVIDVQAEDQNTRYNEINSLINSTASAFSDRLNSFESSSNKVVESYADLEDIVNNTKEAIIETVSGIKESNSKQLSGLENIANSTKEAIIETVSDIKESNSKQLSGLENIANSTKDAVIEAVSGIKNSNITQIETLEDSVASLKELLEVTKKNIEESKSFVSDVLKKELLIISSNVEKETDIVIGEIIEQFDILKKSQSDEAVKITNNIESVISEQVYNNIEDLKSYLDVKTQTSDITDKLDSLKEGIYAILDDASANINKMLPADVFTNAISDFRMANEMVVSSAVDRVNEKIEDFLKNSSSEIAALIESSDKDLSEKLNLFDKKFIDTVVDKYEEIKLISNNYTSSFDEINNQVADITSQIKGIYGSFDEKVNQLIVSIQTSAEQTSEEIRELSKCFESLREQISNKTFEEAFQTSLNKQINSLESLVKEQAGYIEDINELCSVNLPDVTELNTLVKGALLTTLQELSDKIENQDTVSVIEREITNVKSEIITQVLNIFNQISFVTEQEEILDFIQDKHDELIDVLSHIVTVTNDNASIKDSVASIRDEVNSINEKINNIISSEGDTDYIYSLQDLESDIANLRLALQEIKDSRIDNSEDFNEIKEASEKAYQLIESLKDELPSKSDLNGMAENLDGMTKDLSGMAEDLVSISTRTNKLILASDESYKTLQDSLQEFKLVIDDLDERTRNFAQESGMDRIDSKLNALNTMVQNGTKTNQVFNEVFEYLAEWVDNAGNQITSISDKVETLDDIGQIKVMLEDLKANSEDNSDSVELIDALGKVFDKQAKKISSLEAKLDKMIVETTISNKNNKLDLSPMEDTLNKFLVAMDEKISSQQGKIKSLEEKLEGVMSVLDEKDTAQLTKKVGGMDRQIAKLNKSIEKIAAHVVEK